MEHKPRFYGDFGKPFTNKDVFVTFFRRKYNYLDIEKVYKELYSSSGFISHDEWNNNLNSINLGNKLSDNERKDLETTNLKMESNQWLSRQRSLRRKGRLSEEQINKLNRLGMVWDPTTNEWDINFQKYKKEGFIYDIRKWLVEQIKEHKNGEMLIENKIRLEAINFPFNEIDPNLFKHTWTSFYILEKKMNNKINEISTTVRVDHSQSRIYVPSKKINEEQNKINSFYHKWHSIYIKKQKELLSMSITDSFKLIDDLMDGKTICFEERKNYLDDLLSKKVFTKNKLPRTYKDINRIYNNVDIYRELTYFNKSKVDSEIREYACLKMLNYYEELLKHYDYRNMKLFPPLKYLISNYFKNKDLKGLEFLLDFVSKFPKLEILYGEKINIYIKKLN